MDEQFLADYRQWLDDIYGEISIRDVTVKASQVYEELFPLKFEMGMTEYLQVKQYGEGQ